MNRIKVVKLIVVCIALILFIGLVDNTTKEYYIEYTIIKSFKTVKYENQKMDSLSQSMVAGKE